MSSQKEKLQKILSLNEASFRVDVIVPLLKKMGFEKVKETHGVNELGKDIVFYEPAKLGGFHSAVVAKAGNISGSASGEKNLQIVLNQINMAFKNPFFNVEDKQNYLVSKVIVWTSGSISGNAEKQIQNQLSEFRNVVFFDGQKTVELLEEFYPAYFTFGDPTISDYFYAAREHYSRIEELRSLGGAIDDHHLPSIFVQPKFTLMSDGRIGVDDYLGKRKKVDDVEIGFLDLLKFKKNYFIVGPAGSGKSALLRNLLLMTIDQNEKNLARFPLPVIIDAKKVDWGGPDCIEASVNIELNRFANIEKDLDLTSILNDGSAIVLIDGVDELRSDEKIRQSLLIISEFQKKHKKVKTVTTSRLLEVLEDTELLFGVDVLNIQPMSTEQMSVFVTNWFGSESDSGKKLMKVVNKPSGLHGLPSTPLTLAIVSILFENGTKEIPANITELFQQYTELILGRWDATKNISQKIEWRLKQFILARLSWRLHNEKTLTIDEDDLRKEVAAYAAERGLLLDVNSFVEEVIYRSELLLQHGANAYEFKHRSFQDYFCGLEINDRPNKLDLIAQNFNDQWWTQAIFFACGLQPQNDGVLEHVLKSVSVPPNQKMIYAITLGQVAQAVYAAPKATKEKITRQVVDLLLHGWNDLGAQFEGEERFRDIIKDVPPQLFLLFPFTLIAQQSLGSVTLLPALKKLASEYLIADLNNMSPAEGAWLEWKAFVVAMACANCADIETFEEIFKSGLIQDPSLLFTALAVSSYMKDNNWISDDDRKRLNDIHNRLDKKSKNKKYKQYLRDLKHVGLLQLPDISEE